MPLDTAPAWTFRNHWMSHVGRHAQMQPHGTALRYQGVDTTWADLDQRSRRLAAGLRTLGVRSGDRVALLCLNHPQFVEILLAANHLGAIAVPLNFRLTSPEVAYVLQDSGAQVIFVDPPLAPVLSEAGDLTVVEVGSSTYADLLGEPIEPGDVPESATALLMYTSGTTGRPKGAMLSHANLAVQSMTCIRAMETFDESDIGFMTAPFFHIAGLGSLAPNLLLGVPTVIHPLGAFDPAAVLDAYEREGATVVFNVPQQWQLLCAEQAARPRTLKLRVLTWGAAPASDALLRQMGATFDGLIVAVFGQTETSPITCVLRGEESLRKLGSVGRPIPTIQYRVVDAAMADVPVGTVGEIVYRGPQVMQGYWNKPAETAAAFAGGWFHSGDLVKQDEEGFVWVVDRKKDMIISGGENIYCAEVENAIADHPAVLEVAVIGRPDPQWGEVPVAHVSLRPESKLTLKELTGFLGDRLASYKRPKELVILPALPRNASGKILKTTLRQQDSP
ncbi:long-chain-fatty-acid--CoA ligase [Branchiibius sp. NY16-3462-2]|uniref:long-chain-fatty-acid--CoA ligase n=1 Tax=Branchiibius sp. NY16-3462-2 TaxID=1807500 RepID=UPI0007997EA3|nr:long-chain-fatty-acid--CoA ligase [Branchiibius sp. NY16-3462-2]KYH45223.1 long-chain fatty acid--CoA ligase [Branchiibius sp. NY16-3462-2]